MAFKLNISEKGKAWKLETESEELVGKKIGSKLKGEEISSNLAGYVLEITGTSDIAGFPGFKEVEGSGLIRKLLSYGKGMHQRSVGKSKRPGRKPRGLRLKKTVRGNTISADVIQINMKVITPGSKKLEEIFPEQNKPKQAEKKAEEQIEKKE